MQRPSRCIADAGPRFLRFRVIAMSYFVYILASRYKGTFYVGVTRDLAKRRRAQGRRRPRLHQDRVTTLVYFEQYESILEARARERVLKPWRREWKIKLIEDLNPTWRDLTPELINL
jgi:putative endonuclease